MSQIFIRPYQNYDADQVINICYKTGYNGKDLTYTNKFNDSKLFGFLFCMYYLLYEPENCFVAVDSNNKIAGYIIGTDNSSRQRKLFILKMSLPIILRLFFYTIWKYPESFLTILSLGKSIFIKLEPSNLFKDYPSHFHINILPEYQGVGVGKKLLSTFENHMKDKNVNGIHLMTSNENLGAIQFYYKSGYTLIVQKKTYFWRDIANYESMIFVKKI